MTSDIDSLLAPISWDFLELRNRIVMAPMTRGRSPDHVPGILLPTYYGQRSSAGLIITEGTFVSRQAVGWVDAPGIWSKEQVDAWKPVVKAVHKGGSRIFLQLWHTGRASHSDFQEGALPVAPSAIRHEGAKVIVPSGEEKTHEIPRALDTREVKAIVQDYSKAAENAQEAGFDGVEIHAANGYLLDEFLQSKTNHRSDEYGGSLENRFRLLSDIVEACSQVFSSERIGVKISPNGSFNDMGSPDYRETFTYVAEQLSQRKLAYLHVVDGLKFGFHELGEPMTLKEFRQVYDGRIIANCGYERDDANDAISDGHADLIAFGRSYIANPDLVERFANDLEFSESDQATWYSKGSKGYTDYPTYDDANVNLSSW